MIYLFLVEKKNFKKKNLLLPLNNGVFYLDPDPDCTKIMDPDPDP